MVGFGIAKQYDDSKHGQKYRCGGGRESDAERAVFLPIAFPICHSLPQRVLLALIEHPGAPRRKLNRGNDTVCRRQAPGDPEPL